MSTALDTELAVEYLMSKETVTNTRLSSLGALHRAVEAGSMPTGDHVGTFQELPSREAACSHSGSSRAPAD